MIYDIVIPAASKDYNKVKFCVASAVKHLNPTPAGVYVISPAPTHSMMCAGWEVNWLNEQDVLSLNPRAATRFNRPQWIYAMFLKMFQNRTPHDKYLVVDSDLIFNRDFNLLSKDGKPQFFLGVDQNHEPYFRFSKTYLGLGREYPHSFISELMLFDKNISQEIAAIRGGVGELYHLCANVACQSCIPADYEIYGNYVYKHYPDLYDITKINTKLHGKYSEWHDDEIRYLIGDMKHEDYDTFTYHTWI